MRARLGWLGRVVVRAGVVGAILLATCVSVWAFGGEAGATVAYSTALVRCNVDYWTGTVPYSAWGTYKWSTTPGTEVAVFWAYVCASKTWRTWPKNPPYWVVTTGGVKQGGGPYVSALATDGALGDVGVWATGKRYCASTSAATCTEATVGLWTATSCVQYHNGNAHYSTGWTLVTGFFPPCGVGYALRGASVKVTVGKFTCGTGLVNSTYYFTCAIGKVQSFSTLTDLLHAGSSGGFAYGLSPPATPYTGEVFVPVATLNPMTCGWTVTAGSKLVTVWVKFGEARTFGFVQVTFATTLTTVGPTGTGKRGHKLGTKSSGPSAPYTVAVLTPGGQWEVQSVLTYAGETTAESKMVVTVWVGGSATYKGNSADCTGAWDWSTPGSGVNTPAGKLEKTTTSLSTPTYNPGSVTPTCMTRHPVTTVATCTLQHPGSWFAALNPFTGGFDPIQVVACPVAWLFVPTSCSVHHVLTVFGISTHGSATLVPTATGKMPATQWVGEMVHTATLVPDAVKTGINSATGTCPIPASQVATLGARLTLCASMATAEVTAGGGLALLKGFVTIVFVAGIIYSLYWIVTTTFKAD